MSQPYLDNLATLALLLAEQVEPISDLPALPGLFYSAYCIIQCGHTSFATGTGMVPVPEECEERADVCLDDLEPMFGELAHSEC